MLSFHSNIAIKEKYVARIKAHREAERLTQGTGWNGEKGCAVGCTLENYDHAQYPVELGIPTWLAYLQDSLFEGLPKGEAEQFAEDFLASIPVGVDLEQVKVPFLLVVLDSARDTLESLNIDSALKKQLISANLQAKDALESNAAADAYAEAAARNAAYAAYAAARNAAYAAADAYTAAAAAAYATAAAAYATAYTAADAAARAAAYDTKAKKYTFFAGELIGLLREAEMKTIDRDALIEKLRDDFENFDPDESSLFIAGYDYAMGKVERFPTIPTKERYTLKEAAKVFIQKARGSFDEPPSPLVWLQGLATVVELWSEGIENE